MIVTRADANELARIIGSLVMLAGKLPGVAIDGLATRAELMAEVNAIESLVGRASMDAPSLPATAIDFAKSLRLRTFFGQQIAGLIHAAQMGRLAPSPDEWREMAQLARDCQQTILARVCDENAVAAAVA